MQCLLLRIRNEKVGKVNNMLICLDSEQKEYFCSDSIGNDKEEITNQHILYLIYLNTLKFSEIPNHELDLKIDIPVMLLKHLNQRK